MLELDMKNEKFVINNNVGSNLGFALEYFIVTQFLKMISRLIEEGEIKDMHMGMDMNFMQPFNKKS